jgi:hypothetical protein
VPPPPPPLPLPPPTPLRGTIQELAAHRRETIGMSDVEDRFWELCDEAVRHDEASYQKSVDESASGDEVQSEDRAAERAMVKIIELVEANPGDRETFVRCFSQLVVGDRRQPFLLVAFCMRRLRFPEIPELIHRDADAHKGTGYYATRMNYWSAINHAYLDKVWENADSFDYYAHEIPRK